MVEFAPKSKLFSVRVVFGHHNSAVPSGLTALDNRHPTLKGWAILGHPCGMSKMRSLQHWSSSSAWSCTTLQNAIRIVPMATPDMNDALRDELLTIERYDQDVRADLAAEGS